MSEREYTRYESPELKEFKKLTPEEQFKKVDELSQKYKEILKVIQVHKQSITVELYVPKEESYKILVEYETYIREKLNNIPIIVLLQERKDANKKRK